MNETDRPAGEGKRPTASEQMLPILLSFISAFVDAICYIGLFRTFTAFITGTLIILAADAVFLDDALITKIVVAVTFIVSLFVWVFILQRYLRRRYVRAAFLTVEAVLLLVFMAGGVVWSPLVGADSPKTMALAVVAVLAMSLQNALMAVILQSHVPTTVMTGNLTRFVVSTIDIFGHNRTEDTSPAGSTFKTRGQVLHYLFVLGAFVVGALVGALGFDAFGFLALALPAAILGFLALISVRNVVTE